MGRHSSADTTIGLTAGPTDRRRLAMAVRPLAPSPSLPGVGLDAETVALRDAPAPVAAPVPPTGPPERLGRRARRAARQEQAEKAALAARLSRAERRHRQVSAFAAVPAPRSPDPSMSGPLAIGALAAARPPGSALVGTTP